MPELTDFEIDLLREMTGEKRGLFWGAAMGEAIESLHARGMVFRSGDKYELTAPGRLEALEAQLDDAKDVLEEALHRMNEVQAYYNGGRTTLPRVEEACRAARRVLGKT